VGGKKVTINRERGNYSWERRRGCALGDFAGKGKDSNAGVVDSKEKKERCKSGRKEERLDSVLRGPALPSPHTAKTR